MKFHLRTVYQRTLFIKWQGFTNAGSHVATFSLKYFFKLQFVSYLQPYYGKRPET